jgi:hypothetical protein
MRTIEMLGRFAIANSLPSPELMDCFLPIF